MLGSSRLRLTTTSTRQEPKRDAQTKDAWDLLRADLHAPPVAPTNTRARKFINALRALLDHLGVMRVDSSNARLRGIAPIIAVHYIDYRRNKFEERLRAGLLTLDATRAWLRRTVTQEVAAARIDITRLREGNAAACFQIHFTAMLDLVVQPPLPASGDDEVVPETLLLDMHHLCDMHREFHYLTLAGALATVVNARGPRPDLSTLLIEWKPDPFNPNDSQALVQTLLAAIPSAEERDALRPLCEGMLRERDAVRTLIASRTRGALVALIHNADASPAATTLATGPWPPTCLFPRIHALAARFRPILHLNRNLYMDFYNTLLEDISSSSRSL